MKPLLVFDMDGVLVEVKESYRETIRVTVQHFTESAPSHEIIQHYKNEGGWNNDWKLSHELIRVAGKDIPYETVVRVFNQFFFGHNGEPGLILRERWIDNSQILKRLSEKYDFAIFTGRLHEEAQITLRRFGSDYSWFAVLGDDNVAHSKPHPDGLNQLKAKREIAWYLGDTIDDARAARDAQVPFIAITAPGGDFQDLPVALAVHSINELESIL
ncbi:HAD-IA family hydrolase [Bryobacter aggregatus]|uniref:HAD-IA family hydrolase n=1 Tax=Bryobacter aggregatus TaxID=360054 RepID=UPI00068EA734|nr:HAD-IA family hydrolase [Bryobacter aggregatus]